MTTTIPEAVEFAPGGSEFVVSKSQIALAGTQEQTLTVKSAVTPTFTTDVDWIKLGAVQRGLAAANTYFVTVSADENPLYDVRTGNITVKAGNNSFTTSVTQYGSETVELISVNPSATLSPNGGSLVINYAATGDVTIESPEWLVRTVSRSLDENSVSFTYSGNYGEEARGGDVVIALLSDPSISLVVPVEQAKAEATTNMSSTAKELVAKMYAGINIGNTMECPDGEGTWSGAVVNQNYILGLKKRRLQRRAHPLRMEQPPEQPRHQHYRSRMARPR